MSENFMGVSGMENEADVEYADEMAKYEKAGRGELSVKSSVVDEYGEAVIEVLSNAIPGELHPNALETIPTGATTKHVRTYSAPAKIDGVDGRFEFAAALSEPGGAEQVLEIAFIPDGFVAKH